MPAMAADKVSAPWAKYPCYSAESVSHRGMADRHSLGDKVRSTRESRNLSAEQLAERAELATDLVAQIESGALIPSLSPLIRIARALGVRLGTFLDDMEDVGPVVSRAGEHETVVRFSGRGPTAHSDLDFFSLAANKAGRHMEPFFIDIHPDSAKAVHNSAHEGEEFIYVLSGEVEVTYGKDTYRLSPGDCIYYDSIVPHHVHSAGGAESRIVAVVYAP
jgi:transcriptional regulator with XRE-family HTH domain